jgi:O-antigen/teichoic acid export membrane protein
MTGLASDQIHANCPPPGSRPPSRPARPVLNRDVIHLARATLRGAAAMSFVGLLAKAMGLVVGILVARYLGPGGLGLFALLLGLSIIAEQIGAFGVPEVVLRAVGANPALARGYYIAGRRVVWCTSAAPVLAFVIAALVYRNDSSLSIALLLTAACVPLTAIGNVGQAALQGLEQVGFVAAVNLTVRIVSLVLLGLLLHFGAGVEAAFIARVAFQGGIMAAYAARIGRLERPAAPVPVRPLLTTALPFAGVRGINELSLRTPTFVVSSLLGLTATGLYDAADRVSQILQVIIGSGLTALMPLFSRSVEHADEAKDAYVRYALKYTVLTIGLAGAALSALGAEIIALLYGKAYGFSSSILGILLGAQVLISADVVVRQALFAHKRERTAMLTAAATIAMLVAMAAALSALDGLRGVAVSVVLAAAIGLSLDLSIAHRAGVRLQAGAYLLRPAIACVPAFLAAPALPASLWPLRLALVAVVFAASCALLGVFSASERTMIVHTLSPVLRIVTGGRAGSRTG